MIVHSYFEFEYPNQITREDIENIMGEPSMTRWIAAVPADRMNPEQPDPTRDSTPFEYAYWGRAGVSFDLGISTIGLSLGTDPVFESAAFMSEARSALSRRLGITWTNFDDEDTVRPAPAAREG